MKNMSKYLHLGPVVPFCEKIATTDYLKLTDSKIVFRVEPLGTLFVIINKTGEALKAKTHA